MTVIAGIRMRKTQREVSTRMETSPRLIAMMARGKRGSRNLKPTIYLPSGVAPKN
jgi:hypothetical protein